MHTVTSETELAWTGERMIPFEADVVTEYFHWQRYLYFRPWYVDAKIVDAASGEGYGAAYASTFGAETMGFDLSYDAVRHASAKYESAQFFRRDVCEVDYSEADLVLSFETIEHLPNPERFLAALASCTGRIVISTPNRLNHSPGNRLSDKPLNEFHTIEWTPSEFAELIQAHFPNRRVRFLSQENRFPGLITEGLSDEAKYVIAVIGEGDLPNWPSVGISIPTCDGARRVQDAIFNFARFYPGKLEIAVLANGSNACTLKALHEIQEAWPEIVHVLESPENIGYGKGANLGLDYLVHRGGFDLYGVSNDDVVSGIDCVSTMTSALVHLTKEGLNPGCVGPVSNSINGPQQVDIGPFSNYKEMMGLALERHRKCHSELTQAIQVRGLFFLVTPECLRQVGGFDPLFGLGNFEDDDWNLRVRRAGFSLWVAGGAFLYHMGSSTFKELGLDYAQNIERNLRLFMEKWNVTSHAEAFQCGILSSPDAGYIRLDASLHSSGHSMSFGQESVDLVWQATDAEFAAAIMLSLKGTPRERRLEVLDLIFSRASSRCAA